MSDAHELDISGIDLVDLLIALYDNASVLGLGVLQASGPLSREQAQLFLDTSLRNGRHCFDYVRGRPIKVCFEGDRLTDAWLYDRDHGQGLCARIVADLRARATPTGGGESR